MRWLMLWISTVLFAFGLALPTGQAAEPLVDLELVLLADASGSINAAEIKFQRYGYAKAIVDPTVVEAITGGWNQKIALTYVEWGDDAHQDVVVPWTVIASMADAEAFAKALMAAPRRAFGYNAIGSALAFGQTMLDGNGIKGLRRVIDFSADSANSWSGVPMDLARAAVLSAGITINGLAILCRDEDCSGRPMLYDLEHAFEQMIIGGPGAFVITVDGPKAYAAAVKRKLILEIAGSAERQFTSR
jgi:hypothetical protein